MRNFLGSQVFLRIGLKFGLAIAFAGLIALPATALDDSSQVAAKRSSYKPYFVEFRARSAATYGHMYVLYGRLNGRGEIVSSDIAGLHPKGDANDCPNCSVVSWMIGHLVPVPGETGASDGDLEEKYVTARYRVHVDAPTFRKVSAHIAKLKADNPMWNALWNNCVTFGNGIADQMGLKTPGFLWMKPEDYVAALREANGGRPQRALRFAAPAVRAPAADASAPLPVPRTPKQAASAAQ